MSEETLVEHGSPTLAGLKSGNLFACRFESREELRKDIRRFNKILVPRGIVLLPLQYRDGRALIYLFRPDRLAKDLAAEEAAGILRKAGYEGGSCGHLLRCLAKRLENWDGRASDFPHEIGLFLSYPPEDVRGFMEEGPHNFKCNGFWKVYGDEEKAVRTFDRFRLCHDVYRRQLEKGTPLGRLAVQLPAQ